MKALITLALLADEGTKLNWLLVVEVFAAIGAVLHAISFIREIIRRLNRPVDKKLTERSRKDYVLGVAYSLLCALLWSLSYISLSYVSPKANLLAVNIVLLGSASLFLLVFWSAAEYCRAQRGRGQPRPIDWKSISPWIVVLTNLASFLLFIYALRFVSASQTISLQKTNPLFIALLTLIWLRKKPSKFSLSAVVLVVFGAILILANDQFRFDDSNNITGSVIALLAGLSFAVFSVGIEKIEQEEVSFMRGLGFMSMVFLLSYIGLVTIGYFEGDSPSFDKGTVGILILNGLRVAIVYGLYQAAIRRIGALLASVVVALEVPFTMVWDWRLLDHVPGTRLVFGAVAILIGAITLVWDRSPWMLGTKAAEVQ